MLSVVLEISATGRRNSGEVEEVIQCDYRGGCCAKVTKNKVGKTEEKMLVGPDKMPMEVWNKENHRCNICFASGEEPSGSGTPLSLVDLQKINDGVLRVGVLWMRKSGAL